MRAEINVYSQQLRWILDQLVVSLSGLTVAQLDWRPSTGGANSANAIVSHVLGATRAYALGFGCGLPVRRDRPAEFAASGGALDALVARVRELSTEIEAAFSALEPGVLDELIRPPKDLWGIGEPHEISRREALVESIRHAGIHLGELRLTRSLAAAAA